VEFVGEFTYLPPSILCKRWRAPWVPGCAQMQCECFEGLGSTGCPLGTFLKRTPYLSEEGSRAQPALPKSKHGSDDQLHKEGAHDRPGESVARCRTDQPAETTNDHQSSEQAKLSGCSASSTIWMHCLNDRTQGAGNNGEARP
jgi:hypothetical protein